MEFEKGFWIEEAKFGSEGIGSRERVMIDLKDSGNRYGYWIHNGFSTVYSPSFCFVSYFNFVTIRGILMGGVCSDVLKKGSFLCRDVVRCLLM